MDDFSIYWNKLIELAELQPEPDTFEAAVGRLIVEDGLISNEGVLYWFEQSHSSTVDDVRTTLIGLGLTELEAHVRGISQELVDCADDDSYDQRYFALRDEIEPTIRRWWLSQQQLDR